MDTVEKFWKKWMKADCLDKEKVLEPIISMILEHDKMTAKMRKRSLAMCMNSYFEDLWNVLEAEHERNKQKQNRQNPSKRKG